MSARRPVPEDRLPAELGGAMVPTMRPGNRARLDAAAARTDLLSAILAELAAHGITVGDPAITLANLRAALSVLDRATATAPARPPAAVPMSQTVVIRYRCHRCGYASETPLAPGDVSSGAGQWCPACVDSGRSWTSGGRA